MATSELDLGKYQLGWSDVEEYVFRPEKGINEAVVRDISWWKGEPEWMTNFRLKALRHFERKPMVPWFASRMPNLDFNDIYYYIKPTNEQVNDWDDLPEQMKRTYEKLGIPEAEQKYFAGVTAQYECLRGDAQVWTTRGMKPIKEIEPGDEVFSLDETTRQIVVAPVTMSACSGVKEVFEVRARGRVVAASANHPFLVLRDEQPVWTKVADLRVGDRVATAARVPALVGADATMSVLPDGPADADASGDVGFVMVESITSAGEEPVYDITVEGRHNFVAEGFVVHNSEVVYHRNREDLEKQGIIFTDMDTALREYPHLVKKYFGTVIPPGDNKFAALNSAVWSGGCLTASARLNVFERGLTSIADVREGDEVYGVDTLHNVVRGKVLAQIESGSKPVFRMNVGGRVLEATANHQFLVARRVPGHDRQMFTEWAPLSDIVEGEALAVSRASVGSGEEVDTDLFPALSTETMTFALLEAKSPIGEAPTYDIQVVGLENFVANGIVAHNSFIYVPPGVNCEMPLQAYFRINSENAGQFERTLIIADEGAQVHYIEGCSAPVYAKDTDSLHSAVVELIAKPGARITYTTIQNWSNNVYNLVTKRGRAEAEARIEWIDGNIGCLAEGSTVTTPSGPKSIEMVTPGEQVLSYDDTAGELVWRTVMAKRYSGEQPVREVRSGVRSLRVTDNHPFYSWKYDASRAKKLGRYALDYVRADELTQAIVPKASIDFGEPYKLRLPDLSTEFVTSNQYADQLSARRTRAPRLAVDEATSDDLMWLFGLFLGDGSIDGPAAASGGRRFAKVTFATPVDDRARARLTELMGHVLPDTTPTNRADGIALTWNSVELASLFEDNGFVTGARSKRVPEWVLGTPESQRLALVAGLLDSDGCAASGQRGFSIKSCNPELLADTARVLTSLGIHARLHTEHADERPVRILGYDSVSRGSYTLQFRADERLLNHVSEALRAAAAAQPSATLIHHRTIGRSSIELPASVEVRKVTVTEHLETVPTWDIEVEGTGNFVSEGFIVHNSKLTMKYPSVYLMGPKASGEVLSVAYAGNGQWQDAGAKMYHCAPETTSTIISKSISKGGGRTTYRGMVHVDEGATKSKSFVRCDALILDEESQSDTYPYMEVGERDAQIGHEATVSKVGDEQLFYLMSRGLSEEQAMGMIVNGFIEPITRTLPMEYAVEWSRLIELQMEGSIG